MILPVWYGIDEKDVRAFSPPLADRIAVMWERGLGQVAMSVLEVVRPDLAKDLRKRVESAAPLTRIGSGPQLGEIMGFGDEALFLNSDPDSEEVPLIAGFLDELRDWGEIWDDIGPGRRVEAGARIEDRLRDVEESGWSVFGRKQRKTMKIGEETLPWKVAVVAVVKGKPSYVVQMGDTISVVGDKCDT